MPVSNFLKGPAYLWSRYFSQDRWRQSESTFFQLNKVHKQSHAYSYSCKHIQDKDIIYVRLELHK